MDVTCDRCKAEYEFDEALLGDKGTTVKCSACGHVFRVLPPNRDAGRSALKLRYAKDGSVKSLNSLRELQQRIRAGEVSLDDELGRDGFPFRSLREVPELKNFFASSPPERATVRPEPSRVGGLPVAPTSSSPERPPDRTPDPTVDVRNAAATVKAPGTETLIGGAPTARPPATRPAPMPSEARPAERPTEPAPPSTPTHTGPLPNQPSVVTQPTATVTNSPESRVRSFGKHTMMGVGPDDLQLPPPPRMPSVPGVLARPARPTSAGGTAQPSGAARTPSTAPSSMYSSAGGAAASSSSNLTTPPQDRTRERNQAAGHEPTLHGVASPVASGSLPPLGAALSTRAQPPGASQPPGAGVPPVTAPRPPLGKAPSAGASYERGGTLSPVTQSAAAAVAAVAPAQVGGPASAPPVEPARRGVAPFDVASSAFPQASSPVEPLPSDAYATHEGGEASREDASTYDDAAPATPLPQLYLDDEEQPPERAVRESSSKGWLLVALLLLAGGGAYVAINHLHLLGEAPVPTAAVAPEPSLAVDAGASAEVSADAGAAPTEQYARPEFAPPIAADDALQDAPDAARDEGAESTAASTTGKLSASDKAAERAAEKAAEKSADKPARERSTAADKPSAKPTSTQASDDAPSASDKPERAAPRGTEPQDYGDWVNRGDQLFSRGDHDGASKAFKAALALRPTGSEANAGLGFALLSAGQTRDSLPYFDRAASSGYAEANIGLGDAYRKLSQPSSAREAYQAYLERLPNGARADYARTSIDKLKNGSGSGTTDSRDKPAPSTPATNEYRPAGELTEPEPADPAPASPSETPP